MITIEISNAREVARREKGRVKVWLATLFGMDIARRVDEVVAERIADELRRRDIDAKVRIVAPPAAGKEQT